jgi:hypothetical protein
MIVVLAETAAGVAIWFLQTSTGRAIHPPMHEPTPALREPRPPAIRASSTAVVAVGVLRSVAIAAIAGLFLAYAGAFGTAAAPLSQRLATGSPPWCWRL